MTTEAKTYDTKFNAQRGAQRTGLKPGDFEVFKTPNGRFGWRRLAVEPAQALPPAEAAPTDEAYEPPAFLRRTEKVEAAVDPEPLRSVSVTERTADSHLVAANAASWSAGPKTGKRKAIIEQAHAGALPAAPDFSKPTHARFRAKLARLVALAEAGDVEGLKAIDINPVSTSPKAMARYRDLAVVAIEARQPES
jgi:hypothetical protein